MKGSVYQMPRGWYDDPLLLAIYRWTAESALAYPPFNGGRVCRGYQERQRLVQEMKAAGDI